MARRLLAFCPGGAFPSLSITGSRCELQCDHCRGRYLEAMTAVADPGELLRLARDLSAKGGRGFLLSGGCRSDGTMPFDDFLDALAAIKRELPLRINMHTGLLDRQRAGLLVRTGVDAFSLDLTPDTREGGSGNMARLASIGRLLDAGASRVVPHICLGLPGIDQKREFEVLDSISMLGVSALVVLVFIPTRGTPLERSTPPEATRVLAFIRRAKEGLDRPVILGCMRPRGARELEPLCIKEGVDALAVPSRRTIDWARDNNYQIEIRKECCALY